MKRMITIVALLLITLTAGFAGAAARQSDTNVPPPYLSISDLKDSDGNLLGFAAVFQDTDGATGIGVIARGLTPGSHGVHIHESGNCDPAGEKAFELAGAHFDPGHGPHPTHAGDLGNLVADDEGDTIFTIFKSGFDLSEDGPTLRDTDGSALVVHADVDDLVTDPSGNSGARIACAVLFGPQ